jgi:hypothetical protein
MKAFVIAAETVKDEAMFANYRAAVPATVEPFGGKFIVRGGALTSLEGEWPQGGHDLSRVSHAKEMRANALDCCNCIGAGYVIERQAVGARAILWRDLR